MEMSRLVNILLIVKEEEEEKIVENESDLGSLMLVEWMLVDLLKIQ